MASLHAIAKLESDTIRDGIAWVIIWKTGRSWHSEAIWMNPETDTFEPEDLEKVRGILVQDANAMIVNGYYCGRFWEEMTLADIEVAIRNNYVDHVYLLKDWTVLQEEKPERPEDIQQRGQQEIPELEPVLCMGMEGQPCSLAKACSLILHIPKIDSKTYMGSRLPRGPTGQTEVNQD